MSVKINIRKTCVNKEYEVKSKNATGPITTAKNEVLLSYNMKTVI